MSDGNHIAIRSQSPLDTPHLRQPEFQDELIVSIAEATLNACRSLAAKQKKRYSAQVIPQLNLLYLLYLLCLPHLLNSLNLLCTC